MIHARTISRLGFAALACAPLSVALGEGSELPDGSVVITSLPFFDTGDTSDNLDDFDAVCPWASDAPDVFYALPGHPDLIPDCGTNYGISVQLCESGYDTKTFILDSAFNEIACNDDFCTSSGGGEWRSTIECATPPPDGATYFIAVDGWSGGEAGPYDLIVEVCQTPAPCLFGPETCPPGTRFESEPCHDGSAPDTFNGGCATAGSPQFESVSCGDSFCGTLASDGLLSDSDWFELEHDAPTVVSLHGYGELSIVIGRVDEGRCAPGQPECACISGEIAPQTISGPCWCNDVSDSVAPGRSWWYVAPVVAGAVPCGGEAPGNDYVVTFECAPISCCSSGDATQDGAVTFDDLIVMLSNWGNCAAPPCCALGDANGDGTIGFDDVVIALANWGPCGG